MADTNKEMSKVTGMSIGDVSVFLKNDSIAKTVGLVNGKYPIGYPLDLTVPNIGFDIKNTYSEPGILAITFIPTPGVAESGKDPINASGSIRFAKMRQRNMSQNYMDIADLTYHFLAGDSLFMAHQFAGNLYTHINVHSDTNLYLPQAIFEALQCDYNDFCEHQADLLFLIKKMQAKIQVMKIPKSLGYVKRHLAMVNAVYKDRNIDKSQFIVFAPKYLWKYDLPTMKLKAIDMRTGTKLTFAAFESIVNDLMNSLLPDEEIQHINADITNYITTDVYTINDLNWDAMKTPVYDESVLQQLHNADFLPFSSVTDIDISQVVTSTYDSIIKWNPTFITNEIGVLLKRVYDLPELSPDYKSVIIGSAFKFTCRLIGGLPTEIGHSFSVQLESVSSELLTGCQIVMFNSLNNMELFSYDVTTFLNLTSIQAEGRQWIGFEWLPNRSQGQMFGAELVALAILDKFNGAPIRYMVQTSTSTTPVTFTYQGILGETQNVIVCENSQLKAIHESMLLSLFDVTSNTK